MWIEHAAGSARSVASPAPLGRCRTFARSTASAAASVRMGRSRLPPAKMLYRIASLTIAGQTGGRGRYRSSASSTWMRAVLRKSPSEVDATKLRTVVVGGKGRGRRLQLAALVQNLDAALGLFEPRVTEARELDAALVERQRLLERQVALFELLDDRLELGNGGLEIFDRCVGHRSEERRVGKEGRSRWSPYH